jgi:2-polyprenyl-6-methoxyphenol hydroxylase-like FAD-dependent oxidoreductase
MAFQDGEKLAWALAHGDGASKRLLRTWATHRQQRVQEVVAYTIETGRRRRPDPNVILQKMKEWVLWGLLRYHGQAGMIPWLSNHDGEKEMATLSA